MPVSSADHDRGAIKLGKVIGGSEVVKVVAAALSKILRWGED